MKKKTEELIKTFRRINGMTNPDDPLAHLQPGPKAYLVPEGKNEFDDEPAIIQIMYLDYFLPEAGGDTTQASINHATWIAGKMQIKDDILSAVIQKLAEKRSHYKGRQLDEENAGYYEIVRSFIESSSGKQTFSAFKAYWRTLPLTVRNNKITPPFSDDTFRRWRKEILRG